jgi:chromosome segregation ATPase
LDTGSQHPQEDLHALEQRSLRLAEELGARLSLARAACRELEQRAGALAGEPAAVSPRPGDLETSRPEAPPPPIDSAQRRLEALETERKALASELNAAREGLARVRTERDALLGEQARLSESVRQVEQQFREAAAVASKEFEVRLQAEQQTQTALREELAQLGTQLTERQERQSRLEQQVEALEATAERVQKAFREQQTREQEQRVELDRVRERLAATEQKDREAEGEKQALTVKSARLRQELNGAPRGTLEQIAGLEQRLGEMESERDAARQQVENLESLLLAPASGPQASGDAPPEAAPKPTDFRVRPDVHAAGEKRAWTTLAAGVVLGVLAGATGSWLLQKPTLQLAGMGTSEVSTAEPSGSRVSRGIARDGVVVPAVAVFPQTAPAAVPGPYRLPRGAQAD